MIALHKRIANVNIPNNSGPVAEIESKFDETVDELQHNKVALSLERISVVEENSV